MKVKFADFKVGSLKKRGRPKKK